MTKKQIAKLNMYHAVDNVLTAHSAIVATVPALVTQHAQLQTNIQAIEDHAEIQDTATDGASDDKEEKQQRLCRSASNMAGFVHAWAVSIGNTLLAEQMNISYSDLLRMKDSLLAERCKTIYDVANANLVDLAPFGVTAAKLTELQTCITDYVANVKSHFAHTRDPL